MHEMGLHYNATTRCESREPQPEGIDRDKFDLISSSRGASWENIFEILFPGARIPSPCKFSKLLRSFIFLYIFTQ